MYARRLLKPLRQALADTPVVLVVGARQSGKTTLVRKMLANHHPARYLTLDDTALLGTASRDPQAFVDGFDQPVIIDEVQRAPELLLAIKRSVDENRAPGRFLLTGSANPLQLPKVADALAGRLQPLTLWPLAQSEIDGAETSFVDRAFAEVAPSSAWSADVAPSSVRSADKAPGRARSDDTAGPDLFSRVLRGGYPEAVGRDGDRRSEWFEAYVTAVLHREVRDLVAITGLTDLPRLLGFLAARTAGVLNFASIAQEADLPQTTLKRYMALLEVTFLLHRIPAWSPNLGRRLIRSPKLMVVDSGLAAHLLGVDRARLNRDGMVAGRLLESFVAMELVRHLGWSATRARLFHFRTTAGKDVDLVLERPDGQIVGIEIKMTSTVGQRDVGGLRILRELAGDRFHRGILLYGGRDTLPLGGRTVAVPITTLWS